LPLRFLARRCLAFTFSGLGGHTNAAAPAPASATAPGPSPAAPPAAAAAAAFRASHARPGMMLMDGVIPFSEDGGRVMPFSEAGGAHIFEAGGGRMMSFSVVAVDGR